MATATRKLAGMSSKLADGDFNQECLLVFAAGYVGGIDMLKEAGRKKNEIRQIVAGETGFVGICGRGDFSLTLFSRWTFFFFASDHDVLKQVVTHRENSDTWKTLLTDRSKKK